MKHTIMISADTPNVTLLLLSSALCNRSFSTRENKKQVQRKKKRVTYRIDKKTRPDFNL